MSKATMITFTKEEVELFHQIGKYADYIDNNFHNVPSPEENCPTEFNQFKTMFLEFLELFEKFYEAGIYRYMHRRTKEMDNLLTKLTKNAEFLESNESFWDNIYEWSLIKGNNIEIDYIIAQYIENYGVVLQLQ